MLLRAAGDSALQVVVGACRLAGGFDTLSSYARVTVSGGLSAWGLAGFGTGDMTIVQAASDATGQLLNLTNVACARLTGPGAPGGSPAGRGRPATTSVPSHELPSVRMEVKRCAPVRADREPDRDSRRGDPPSGCLYLAPSSVGSPSFDWNATSGGDVRRS